MRDRIYMEACECYLSRELDIAGSVLLPKFEGQRLFWHPRPGQIWGVLDYDGYLDGWMNELRKFAGSRQEFRDNAILDLSRVFFPIALPQDPAFIEKVGRHLNSEQYSATAAAMKCSDGLRILSSEIGKKSSQMAVHLRNLYTGEAKPEVVTVVSGHLLAMAQSLVEEAESFDTQISSHIQRIESARDLKASLNEDMIKLHSEVFPCCSLCEEDED